MNQIAKSLAVGIDVKRGMRIENVCFIDGAWEVYPNQSCLEVEACC